MVRPDGKLVLLDFGAVCRVQSKTMTVTQMVSAGYSPFEQYTTRAKQGPYTDIYALGATMVKAITGKKPDDASDRVYGDEYQSLGDQKKYQSIFGRRILSAIDAALIMEADKRPQTMVEWRGMMVEILRPKKKSSPSRGREVLAVTEKILDDSPSSEKSLPAKLSPVSPTCRIDDDVQSFSWVGRWKIFVDTIKRKLLS